jgi:hypothetical protein
MAEAPVTDRVASVDAARSPATNFAELGVAIRVLRVSREVSNWSQKAAIAVLSMVYTFQSVKLN